MEDFIYYNFESNNRISTKLSSIVFHNMNCIIANLLLSGKLKSQFFRNRKKLFTAKEVNFEHSLK